jgi:hypothetical protein
MYKICSYYLFLVFQLIFLPYNDIPTPVLMLKSLVATGIFYRVRIASHSFGSLNERNSDVQWTTCLLHATHVCRLKDDISGSPSLNMVIKNVILAALRWITACGPRLTANRNVFEHCVAWRHKRRAECRMTQIVSWTVRISNPGKGEIFRTRPDRPWGPPSLLYSGYRFSLSAGGGGGGGNAAGAWRWSPPPTTAEIKERLTDWLTNWLTN